MEDSMKSSPDKGRKYVAPKPKIRKKAPGEMEAQTSIATFTELVYPSERFARPTECSKLHFEATKEYVEGLACDGMHPTILHQLSQRQKSRSNSPVRSLSPEKG